MAYFSQNDHSLDSVTIKKMSQTEQFKKRKNFSAEQDHDEPSFFTELHSNDLDAITVWLNSFDINSESQIHKTPLFIAIEKENLALVELLVSYGVDVNEPSFCPSQNVLEGPLCTAARINSFQIVNLLVQNGANLETDDQKIEGKTALQWAVSHGNKNMAAFLLLQGADINCVDQFSNTVLHDAVIHDNNSMILWLLENGAKITANHDGRSPLHIAALNGNVAAVKYLMSYNCNTNMRDNYGFYPLSLAYMKGHYSIIYYLKHNSKFCEDSNMMGLHRAAELGHLEVIKYLLESGVDLNAIDSADGLESPNQPSCKTVLDFVGKDSEMKNCSSYSEISSNVHLPDVTPIMANDVQPDQYLNLLSLEKDNFQSSFFDELNADDLDAITKLLNISSFDINFKNYMQKTPLFVAIEKENMALVELLVSYGANVNETSYCPSQCVFELPLVSAARINSSQIVYLLLHNGANLEIDDPNIEGRTALQWAAYHGNKNMAMSLLLYGADINWIGQFMNTALHYAVLRDKTSMVLWLLENGAETTINGDGRNALHIAAVRGNIDAVKHLMTYNCNTDIKDSYGFYPLSLACLRGHLEIVKYIKENSRQCKDLDDGLHRASELGHLELLGYLLKNGADINSINYLGETALAIASRGQRKSTQLLIQSGAKLNIVDNRGYSCLQNAIMREQVDIAVNLILNGADVNDHHPNTDSPLKLAFTLSNPVLVKCIIDSGCNFRKEKWFTQKVINYKSQELDYFRSVKYHKGTDDAKSLWKCISDKLATPPTLLESARQSLRVRAIEATDGCSTLNALNSLTLPFVLKRFVTLEYYVYN